MQKRLSGSAYAERQLGEKMTTEKRYRINFLARSVNTVNPSSQAVASAVENALRSIGLKPTGSSVESSKEVKVDEAEEASERAIADENIRALQQAASRDDG
jgi:hypothetical protein